MTLPVYSDKTIKLYHRLQSHNFKRGIRMHLPSSFSTTEMVSLTLNLRQYISRNIKQLQVCYHGSYIYTFQTQKIIQMLIIELVSHNSIACFCLSQRGKEHHVYKYSPFLWLFLGTMSDFSLHPNSVWVSYKC